MRLVRPGGPPVIKRVPLFRIASQESLDSPIDRRSDYYRQRAREEPASAPPGPALQPLLTAPNALTIFRIVLVPVVVVLWFSLHWLAPLAVAAVFIIAALTDWADGYLARKMKLTSAFGAFLDPVADKLMVSTVLILLAVRPPAPLSQKDMTIPVVIMIGREITMSALREWAAASGGAAHRAVKMVGISALLIMQRAEVLLGSAPRSLEAIRWGSHAALGVLWAGAFLAVWSLSNYMANVWAYFRHPSGGANIAPGTPPLGSPRESLLAGPGLPLPRRRSSPLPVALNASSGSSKGKLT
ncbi:hypothetical protein WJX81_007458 [Elliptochloris bilobata]|uniref:CDP-diacylglycerol--glycerol-3-phosphate 3-phosphatidyltransferase n=1 Tax=Elliptochloris bilobata TaxID=381761 RepID=A0AAW1QJL4_9CHLO